MAERVSIGVAEYPNITSDNDTVWTEICGKKVYIKQRLGLAESVIFAEGVAAMVVDADDGTYMPELFNYAFGVMLILHYTNIELPDDIGERFALICHTDMVFTLAALINDNELENLREAAHRRIEHLLRVVESSAASKMADLFAKFEQLQAITSELYGNISAAELKAMIDNFAGMDEANIAKAVLEEQEKRGGDSVG